MLRLAIRDDFRKRLRLLTIQDLNDPNELRPDPNAGEKMFRQLLDTISNNLKVKFVAPKDIIIFQSEQVIDFNGNYDEEKAFFYIILNGNFKVSSLKFNKRKKEEIQNESINDFMNNGRVDDNRGLLTRNKMLVSGDYFGEVSFLYNCRRTSTIKAEVYATLGQIDH